MKKYFLIPAKAIVLAGIFLLASCGSIEKPDEKPVKEDLASYLKKNEYMQIPLQRNKIGHFVINGKVNGKQALFILDTGASATCLDFGSAKKLEVNSTPDKDAKSAGYGGDATDVGMAQTIIELESFKTDSMLTAIIDLTSVNQAYASEVSGHIDGVIGADILQGKNAVIDYATNTLYLKISPKANNN